MPLACCHIWQRVHHRLYGYAWNVNYSVCVPPRPPTVGRFQFAVAVAMHFRTCRGAAYNIKAKQGDGVPVYSNDSKLLLHLAIGVVSHGVSFGG